ncbi:MAG: energy transducer TonB [Nannocystaceae bacterium]
MFEHYLTHHRGDPKRRLRLFLSGNIAAVATVGMLAFTYVADRFDIVQVDAPSTDYIMFQMSSEVPLAAPPPPPPPLGSDEDKSDEPDDFSEPDDIVPVEKISPPKAKRKTIGSPFGHKNGVEGGVKDGIPGGHVGSLATTGFKLPIGVPQVRKTTPPAPEPIRNVRARCDYCPNPDMIKLSATSNAMFGKRNGRNKTHFCLDVDGTVSSVRTAQKFPGDPQVDAICRAAVKKWRVRPQKVSGRARKTCSTVTFDLKFQ